jgi:hypothetical protein
MDFKAEIEKISEAFIEEIKNELREKNNVASGDLIDSLKTKANEMSADIEFNSYLLSISEGRKPSNKNPSKDMVERVVSWMKYKRMRPLARRSNGRFRKQTPATWRSSAFAISKSILSEGYKGTNAINKAWESVDDYAAELILSKLTAIVDEKLSKITINKK